MKELAEAELAQWSAWSVQRTLSLAGRCRGDLLGPWEANVVRRFGADASGRVRRRLAAQSGAGDVSGHPTAVDWLPVSTQLLLTRAIVDELLGGDALSLYPHLLEDTRRGSGALRLAVLRRLGVARVLRRGVRMHSRVYDVGALVADVETDHALLRFSGADLFEHPTWRLLQVYAQRALLDLCGTTGGVTGLCSGERSFALRVEWR